MSDDVTIGEISRRLTAVEAEMHRGFTQTATQLERLAFVPREVWTAERRELVNRIEVLEERSKWIVRALAGAMISAVASALVILFIARGGS